jgi:hypothetical protein
MEDPPTKRNRIIKIFKIISFIPLILYPLIFLANLMSLIGNRSGKESIYLLISTYAFLIFSTLYPLTLIYSLKYNKNKTYLIAVLPLIHIAISAILFLLWINAE